MKQQKNRTCSKHALSGLHTCLTCAQECAGSECSHIMIVGGGGGGASVICRHASVFVVGKHSS